MGYEKAKLKELVEELKRLIRDPEFTKEQCEELDSELEAIEVDLVCKQVLRQVE
jgi:hypothetical protein